MYYMRIHVHVNEIEKFESDYLIRNRTLFDDWLYIVFSVCDILCCI